MGEFRLLLNSLAVYEVQDPSMGMVPPIVGIHSQLD